MRKLLRKLHLWLALPFGLVVTLICFSGAMLVFEEEVMRLVRPDLYYVDRVGTATLPVGELARRAAAALPDGVGVKSVNIPADPRRTWQVVPERPKRAWVAVDPYTGEVRGYSERAPFFTVMFRLHRWLLDDARPEGRPAWGKLVVGTSTLLFVLALLTGVVLWWPRSGRALRRSLTVTARRGWRRLWYDLHVAGGMYALVLLLRSFANVENIISMWVVSVLAFLSYYLINWGLFKIAGSPAGLLYVLSYSIWVICYSMVVITIMYLFMIKKTERYHKDRYFK